MVSLGSEDEHRAYAALRAVLHTLRDRLPVVEAAHLGAQLPMLIRGIYYEGWTPVDKPLKLNRDEFLQCVESHFVNEPAIDGLRITRAVIDTLTARVDTGQMNKVAALLPRDFADLWPLPAAS